jgi:hypothetical protein
MQSHQDVRWYLRLEHGARAQHNLTKASVVHLAIRAILYSEIPWPPVKPSGSSAWSRAR